MQEMPKRIMQWTEIDRKTGTRLLKSDAPEDVRKEAVKWEEEFYKKTARRRITNIEIPPP